MPPRYKVLITGSSGMLGVDLSQELDGKFEVFGMDVVRRSSSVVRKFYKCDITKKQEVADFIKRVNSDIVIHAAAWTDVDGCELDPKKAYKVNSEGTKNVALACKSAGVPLIYISTDFVFDGKKKSAYVEDDRTNPISAYGDSKLKGEEAVRDILKEYYILRTSWLYGRHGKNFVDTILAKAKSEKALQVVNDQVGSPTFTRDLAKAIRALLDTFSSKLPGPHSTRAGAGEARSSKGYGIYHVSNAGSVSWYEYAKEILRLARSGTKVDPISSKKMGRPAKRPAMSALDNSKFIKFTGYRMRNWKEALRDYIEMITQIKK
jgi:dTDP-4-dehydrorhamnose reductase